MNAATTASTRARRAFLGAGLFAGAVPAVALTCILAATAIGMTAVRHLQGAGVVVVLVAAVLASGAWALLFVRRPARAATAGLVIDGADEPELVRLVERAAQAIGATAPSELRVTTHPDVALRREDGRSVLTIGACWLTATSAAELTVAVAHAIALDRSGSDSRLLDERLARAEVLGTWRIARVLWGPYLRGARRLRTRASELQLRAADAACAQAFGLDALDRHLRVAFAQGLFAEYWQGDVEPCLSAGFAPPILAGWNAMRSQPWFRDQLADLLAAAALTLRSEAVRAAAGPDMPPPGGAVALRAGPADLERRMLAATYPESAPGVLVPIGWDAVADAVWLPLLRADAREAGLGEAFEVGRLVEVVRAAAPLQAPSSERIHPLACALAIALVDVGWQLETRLGEPIEVHRDGVVLAPGGLCAAAAEGSLSAREWAEVAADAGIADLVIAPPGTAPDEPLLAGATAVPARPPVRIELDAAPGRARGTAVVVLGIVLGLPSGLLFVALAFGVAPLGAGLAVAGFGVAVLAALAAWATSRLRVLHATGTLVVTSDGIRIEHPGLLKAPFEIERGAVRSVSIDEGVPSDTRFPVSLTGFSLAGAAGAGAGFLWVRGIEAVVPCLGAPGQDPNLLVLLESPMLGPRARVATPAGPLPGEALVGLLLCVADAAAARAAFEPWGLTRIATCEDAGHVLRGFATGATTRSSSG